MLSGQGPKDGGLRVLKNSHKLNDEYFTKVWNGTDGFRLPKDIQESDFVGDHLFQPMGFLILCAYSLPTSFAVRFY